MNIEEVVRCKQWVRNGDLEIRWDGLYFVNRAGFRLHEAPLTGWELILNMTCAEAFSCGKMVQHKDLDGFWSKRLYGMPEDGWEIAQVNVETMKLYLNTGHTVSHCLHPGWSMCQTEGGSCERTKGPIYTWWDIESGWEIML
jgi:hypothetical protein